MSGHGGSAQTGPSSVSTQMDAERALWMAVRQALLISLGAVEIYLGLERSAPPRRARRGRLRAKATLGDGGER